MRSSSDRATARRRALGDLAAAAARLRRSGLRAGAAALRRAARAGLSAARDVLGEGAPSPPSSPAARSSAPSSPAPSAPAAPVSPTVAPFLTTYPPGHFYSPLPDLAEIAARRETLFSPERALPGIDLREDEQLARFRVLAALAREAPLARVPGETSRYRVENPNYGVGDASMLQAMLRHLRPRRYLEVGSGYTTALALDVADRFLGGALEVTAIEPHPEVLRAVVRPDDPVEVLAQPVQEVPLERFGALEEGDVLFVDCSHVAKVGSDVVHLYTQVLPVLAPGVVVHVHDVFWPFEYLRHWVEEGRAWNEAYLLHAFLLFNDAYEILLWNHFLAVRHPGVVEAELPEMMENPGGAIWLRRT